MDELKENVQRGAQLLDQEYPGWAHAIQLEYLDMADMECCIVGQLYGHYCDGLEELGIEEDDADEYYGFEKEDQPNGYELLDHHWKQEIQSRLSQ